MAGVRLSPRCLLILSLFSVPSECYRIGVGIADMTGPIAEVAFMGYAQPNQRGNGLHLRQFSRCFIIQDGSDRLVFVSADIGMMSTMLRKQVVKKLVGLYGKVYNEQNVMLSGTHTHSAPGGYMVDLLFDLNTFGFVEQTFNAYLDGILRSIQRAHKDLSEGKIFVSRTELLDASVNRSPTAYDLNPQEERDRYKYNVDKDMLMLKFIKKGGRAAGALTWFAVHPTSMNNSNKLVSSDNLGYASVLFEQKMNPGHQIGKGPFVAGFCSTNLGDVSPNTEGPKCVPSGSPCDLETSTCPNSAEKCIAFGPGRDMFHSTSLIAHKIFNKAYEAWEGEGKELKGRIRSVHRYLDMPSQKFLYNDPLTGTNTTVEGCMAAMGYSFAAGTTDGAGADTFKQSTRSTNPLWNTMTRVVAPPTEKQISCQGSKPILFSFGEVNFPYEWQPRIVSTGLAQLGRMAIACVPGEFTTMSGRRLRRVLALKLAIKEEDVIIAGLCNTYSDYITTREEYEAQRYEGASTIFGPHTLSIHLKNYQDLADFILQEKIPAQSVEPGPVSDLVSLLPSVMFDYAGWGRSFGEVLLQPEKVVRPGQTVRVLFVAGHPRNHLLQEESFLYVERIRNGTWHTVATDANWETKFLWERTSVLLGTSEVEVRWEVPQDLEEGAYRIRHVGYFKYVYNEIGRYDGATDIFRVLKARSSRSTSRRQNRKS